jgi:hypothetical protein
LVRAKETAIMGKLICYCGLLGNGR